MINHDIMVRDTSKYVGITQPTPNPIRNPPKPNPDDLLMKSRELLSIHKYITFACCVFKMGDRLLWLRLSVRALSLAFIHLVISSGGDEYPHNYNHVGPEVQVPSHQRLDASQDDDNADDYSDDSATLREAETLVPSRLPGRSEALVPSRSSRSSYL
jgi:hypothetical protein